MHFPKWFRYTWWVLLLIGASVLIYFRHDYLLSQQTQLFDTILLGVTAALALIPFFAELSVFGVTMKQPPEEAKTYQKINKPNVEGTDATSQSPETDKTLPLAEESLKPATALPHSSESLRIDMTKAIQAGNFELSDELFKKFQDLQPEVTRQRSEGRYYYLCYLYGRSNSLKELVGLSIRATSTPDVQFAILVFLGRAYESSSDYQKAIVTYKQAMSVGQND